MQQITGLRVDRGERLTQRSGPVRGWTEKPKRVVALVIKRDDGRESGDLAKAGLEVFAIAVARLALEILGAMPERRRAAGTGTGDQRLIDQTIVLEEAHEDTTEHPSDGGLRDLAVAPLLQRHRGPLGGDRFLVFEREVLGDL